MLSDMADEGEIDSSLRVCIFRPIENWVLTNKISSNLLKRKIKHKTKSPLTFEDCPKSISCSLTWLNSDDVFVCCENWDKYTVGKVGHSQVIIRALNYVIKGKSLPIQCI